METVEILALVCSGINVVLLIIMLVLQSKRKPDSRQEEIEEEISELSQDIEVLKQQSELNSKTLMDEVSRVNNSVVNNISMLGDNLRSSQEIQQKNANEKLSRLESEFSKISGDISSSLEQIRRSNTESMDKLRGENQQSLDRINNNVNEKLLKLENDFNKIREDILASLESSRKQSSADTEKQRDENRQSLDRINSNVNEKLLKLENDFNKIREEILASLEIVRRSNSESIEKLRTENRQSLDKINDTVNEKLQKTLNDRIAQSFSAVNDRLEQVHKGLGEMKSVATGVSDLKNVLANVKTRGTLGEIQLGAILDQILAPGQYSYQQAVVRGRDEKVDYAIKLPSSEKNGFTYLPIDSKFPQDKFTDLLEAYESGDKDAVKQKRSALESEIKREAKSIRDKYIVPPYTTDFALLFLPTEGLYAEVIKMGLVERLQNEYRVNVCGPSTMAAMLNSLQMCFRAVTIQKKSGEVWKILESAKKEFKSFGDVLRTAQKQIRQADENLGKLIGQRSQAIEDCLINVGQIDSDDDNVLKIEDDNNSDAGN